MRSSRLALLSILVLAAVAYHWHATSGAAEKPPLDVGTIGLLDLKRLFDSHREFAARLTALEKDIDAAEEYLKDRRDAYELRAKELSSLPPDSEQYRQLEEDIKRMAADVDEVVAVQKRQFLEQKAAIYGAIHEKVLVAVNEYAAQHGINLILRYNGTTYDRKDPDEVLNELNRSVIYFDKRIDITDAILAIVNAEPQP